MNIYLLIAFICGFAMGVVILTLFGIMKADKTNRDDRLEKIYRSIENNDKVPLEDLNASINDHFRTEFFTTDDNLSLNKKIKDYYFSVKRKFNKVKD